MIYIQCCHGNGSIYMKMMTSQVIQVKWLIGQLINPKNLHVSRNLSILILVLVELEQKTKLTNYWPVYGLADDVTTTSNHNHIIVYCLLFCVFFIKVNPSILVSL